MAAGARQHLKHLRERDSCGERGPEFGAVAGHAGDVRARDCEGEEGQGRTPGKEGEGQEEDRVSSGLISCEITIAGDGPCWPRMWSGDGV